MSKNTSNREMLLILGNQLFPLEHIKKTKVKKIFMAEDFGLTTNHKHHKLKILMFLWSMRQYRDNLVQNGYTVFYHSIDEESFHEKYEDKLLKVIQKHDIEKLKYFEIEDSDFEEKIIKFINEKHIDYELFQSPMFLTSRNDFFEFAKEQKKLIRMASFYQTFLLMRIINQLEENGHMMKIIEKKSLKIHYCQKPLI